jgi:(1->4)-alpha-D-glucan 1-alpha-D-glucosylmutase
VPDIYQGCELWNLSLVDPDNRGPVDFAHRQALLAELEERARSTDATVLARELTETSADGRIKLFTIWKTLKLRRARQTLFTEGSYQPLTAHGPREDHVCSFSRTLGNEAVLVVVPRLCVSLMAGQERYPLGSEVWQDTWLALPGGTRATSYRDVFTGAVLQPKEVAGARGLLLSEVLSYFPLALLEATEDRRRP